MALAIENFTSGTAQFSTFGGAGSIGSTQAGTITTGGTNRLVVIAIGTGRSKVPGDLASVNADSITASGLTFTRRFTQTYNYTFPFADGSFPNACMAWDIWTAPAAAAQTALNGNLMKGPLRWKSGDRTAAGSDHMRCACGRLSQRLRGCGSWAVTLTKARFCENERVWTCRVSHPSSKG